MAIIQKRVKVTSNFMDKVIDEPHLIKTAKGVIGSIVFTIDSANLPDKGVLKTVRMLCFDDVPSEVKDQGKLTSPLMNDMIELQALLWEDINTNFKPLKEGFLRDFKGEALARLKKYPEAFTLGSFLKVLMVSLERLEKN